MNPGGVTCDAITESGLLMSIRFDLVAWLKIQMRKIFKCLTSFMLAVAFLLDFLRLLICFSQFAL